MSSKIRMLLWERWRCTRGAVVFVWITMVALTTMATIGRNFESMAAVIIVVSPFLLVFLCVRLFANSPNTTSLLFGFTARHYRLPAPAWLLALTHVSYSIAVLITIPISCFAVLSLSALWANTELINFFPVLVALMCIHAAPLLACFLTTQLVLWHSREKRQYVFVSLSIIAGIGMFIAGESMIPPMVLPGTLPQSVAIDLRQMLFLLFPILLTCLFAFTDRRGCLWTDVVANRFTWSLPMGRRSKPFHTPFGAQVWFEFKQIGLYLPVITLASFVASAILLAANQGFLSAGLLFVLPPCAAHTLTMSRFERERTSGISCFYLTRPFTTASLAAARNLALASGVLLNMLILLAARSVPAFKPVFDWFVEFCTAYFSLWTDEPNIEVGILAYTAFTWLALRYLTPFLFFGVFFFITVMLWESVSESHFDIGRAFAIASPFAIAAATLLTFFAAGAKHLLSQRTVQVAIAVWLIGMIALFAPEHATEYPMKIPEAFKSLYVRTSFATLAVLPLATTPLWIHRFRVR
jgi:hypothetical protein